MKYILLLVCFPAMLFAQGGDNFKLPEIIPPSPTVASLMHFEEVPVDFYTGQPDINIPLHSKKLNADITMPITLKYSTQGVKRTERSGWTGTGWSLEAGGTISRTVRGLPDDLNKPAGSQGGGTGIYNLPNNEYFNFSTGALNDTQKNEYMWNIAGTSNMKYDSQPDLYQFSILGATGRFVVLKHGNELIPKLLSKDQSIKIIPSWGTNFSITKFIIIDANGNQYTFGDGAVEETEFTPWSIIYPVNHTGVAPDMMTPYSGYTHKSAWHLTKITTSNPNSELVNLTYTNVQEEYDSYVSVTENRFLLPLSWMPYVSGNEVSNPYKDYNASAFKPEKILNGGHTIVQTKKLNTITFRDKTNIKFIRSGSIHPENSGAILSRIELYDASNQKLKQYSLLYETTTPPNQNLGIGDIPLKRLWLTELRESATDDLSGVLKYILEYFDKGNLPPFGQGDTWGYASGDNRPSGGEYDLDMCKRGLLTRIIYPTGGGKEFDYEPHTFSYEGNQLIGTEYSDKNPYNAFSGEVSKELNVIDDDNPGFSNVFYIPFSQTVSMNIHIISESDIYNPTGESHPGRWYYEVRVHSTNSDGTSTGTYSTYSTEDSYHTFSLAPGYYKFTIRYNFNRHSIDDQFLNAAVRIRYSGQTRGNNYYQSVIAGGARIKEIAFKEKASTSENVRRFRYYYDEPKPEETIPTTFGEYIVQLNKPTVKSSGSVDVRVGSLRKEYTYNHKAFIKGSSGQCLGGTEGSTIGYKVITDELNAGLTKGGYVGYKFVRVREVGTGYTAYTYSSPQDFPTPSNYFQYPFMPKPDLDYKRGLLLKKEVFDESGKIVQEIINDLTTGYEYIEQNIQLYPGINAISYVLNEMACPWRQFYSNYGTYDSNSPNSEIPCGYIAGDCGAGEPTPAPYSFMPEYMKATTARLKKSIKKDYFYHGEASSIVQTQTEYVYNDFNNQIQKEIKTIHEGNEVNIYETRYEYPIGGYTASLFDTAPENEQTILTQMKNDFNVVNKPLVTETFKNDEPLHKIINKYKVFEGSPQIKEIESLKADGTREDRVVFSRYDALGNPLEVSMKEGTKICYIWGYNETLPIAKVEGVASYTAMENALPQNFIANLKAASNASTYNETTLKSMLETLRTTLSGAMVTTLVHDPAKGVELLTDPRGDFFTYEYDNMGRLKWVKDRDGNLVSEHYYHYRAEF